MFKFDEVVKENIKNIIQIVNKFQTIHTEY